jgi:protein tyrosine/serine phosphatase
MTRWVRFVNVFNFRDFAVPPLVAGKLYRSSALSTLDDVDRARYLELGVDTVIDLRRPHELTTQGKAPEWSYASWHHLQLTEAEWPGSEGLDEVTIAPYLADRYIEMSERGADGLTQVLTLLSDPATGVAVVHCFGGRDRTGFVIAMLQTILGVPDEEIAADYTLSTEFIVRWQERHPGVPLAPSLLYSPAAAMLIFLARLRERHGSVAEYLRDIGLPTEVTAALRHRFLR